MSGLFEEPPEGEDPNKECVPWIEVKYFDREKTLYFFGAWSHAWYVDENFRNHNGGMPPYLRFKTQDELIELGVLIVEAAPAASPTPILRGLKGGLDS